MGIDKEDIRDMYNPFQFTEIRRGLLSRGGRAERDGNISNCILLYSEINEIKPRRLIRYNTPHS